MAAQRPTLDQLVDQFFKGAPPTQLTEANLREAMMRQVINCHAMIGFEFERAMDLGEGETDMLDDHPRAKAYGRVEQLSGALRTMMKALEPPQLPALAPGPEVKRHALQIEVVRRGDGVRTIDAAPQPPKRVRKQAIRWPREAYFDDNGVFNPDLYEELEDNPDLSLDEARRLYGFMPYEPPPSPD